MFELTRDDIILDLQAGAYASADAKLITVIESIRTKTLSGSAAARALWRETLTFYEHARLVHLANVLAGVVAPADQVLHMVFLMRTEPPVI